MRAFLEGLALEPEAVEAVLSRLEAMEQAHAQQLRQGELERSLERAVAGLGGRNVTAIRALLDEQAVLRSENMDLAARQAVGQVKREHGYLFQSPGAQGTGSARAVSYSMEELGSMSMAEYKRARRK